MQELITHTKFHRVLIKKVFFKLTEQFNELHTLIRYEHFIIFLNGYEYINWYVKILRTYVPY